MRQGVGQRSGDEERYAELSLDIAIGYVIGTLFGSLAVFYMIAEIVSAFLWLKNKFKEFLSKAEKSD